MTEEEKLKNQIICKVSLKFDEEKKEAIERLGRYFERSDAADKHFFNVLNWIDMGITTFLSKLLRDYDIVEKPKEKTKCVG